MSQTEGVDRDEHVPVGDDYVSDRRFTDFPVGPEVLQGIQELGYVTATPVQATSIEPALAGQDMVVRAKTGTGKTAAFCVPIVERVVAGSRYPQAIILAPTRELAQQIADECAVIAKYKDVSVALLVGGVAMGPQEKALADGAEIIVGTPGRTRDHARRRNLDLSKAGVACLDEADEMVSMGFLEDVTAILDLCASDRQVLLFSATISPETQRIIHRYLHEPVEVTLSTDTDRVEGIRHVLYEAMPGVHKARTLLYVLDLEDPGAAIIFCNTREDTATVAAFLDRQGLDVQLISGELPQSQRTRVMQKVKRGEVRFLVATDVAARGIDIDDITHVVNYSLPRDASLYMHRIGRTGRIGKAGIAISIMSGGDLSTRRTLEGQFDIPFEHLKLPPEEEIIAKRVERQAEIIRRAMGNTVFEAYLPTVRALIQREDGEVLLASALRAFFQWERTRRAEASGVDSVAALGEAREEAREAREDGSGRGRKKGGRKERDRDRGDRDEDRERRKPRKERPAAKAEDLDDLLVAEAAPAESEGGEKKKKKRRRRKKSEEGEPRQARSLDDALLVEGEPAEAGGGSGDDLDALLSME